MKSLQQLLTVIMGNRAETTFEERLFHFSLFIAFSLCLFFLALVWIANFPYYFIGATTAGVLVYALLYYLSRWQKKRSIAARLFFAYSVLYLSYGWFITEGINGPIGLIYAFALVLFLNIFASRYHLYIALVVLFNVIALCVIQIWFPQWILSYPNEIIKQIGLFTSNLVFLISIAWVLNAYKQNYERKQRQVEQQNKKLKISEAKLLEAKEAAETANLAKSTFLANASHELRTPMNAILGYGEMLLEEAEAEQNNAQAQDLKKILQAAKNLLKLINNILDLSKAEAGKVIIHIENFELVQLLYEMEPTLSSLMNQSQNGFHLECPEQKIFIQSDRIKVRQILFNLLSNTAKFTSQGQVSLCLRQQKNKAEEGVSLWVEGCGEGLEPEKMSELFERFTQIDASTCRNLEISGVGLALTKNLCSMLGGHITLEAHSQGGACFHIWLPLKSPSFTTTSPFIDSSSSSYQLSPNKVLVIDDDVITHDLLQRFLDKRGFQLLSAFDGQEGLQMAKDEQPIAIILDVIMPKMDGWMVLEELKKSPLTQSIPVIMISIAAEENMGIALGVSDYLHKPFRASEIESILNRYKTT